MMMSGREIKMDKPDMKDSGERRTFASGAIRDRGGFKPRPDLISPHANLREGAWLAVGAEKYGTRNYEKGMPISDCIASLTRHLEAYKLGLTDEDHMAAIRTNAGFILHFEGEIKAGRMDPSLDDMPHYEDQGHPWPLNEILTVNGQPIQWNDKVKNDRDIIQSPEQEKILKQLYSQLPKPGEIKRKVKLKPNEPPTYYICGPMRNIKYNNFPLFDKVAKFARTFGYTIISPAELDREHGIDPINDPGSFERALEADPNLVQTIAQRDCEVILGLKKDRGDGLILLPDWPKSEGGRAEVALALWLGLSFMLFHIIDNCFELMDSKDIKQQLFYQENK